MPPDRRRLRLAAEHVKSGGLLVVDDYEHPDWPGAASAIRELLAERADDLVVAARSRRQAKGQKRYLVRQHA